uniref:Replication-associated protein n=1 Tax=Pygoscelis antarcticus TaxID=79643 RepID=A0A7G7LKE8_PYGAN|nr:replication-associated protein [Pygoscelis antarcticus]
MSEIDTKTDTRVRSWIVTLPAETYDKETVEEALKIYSYRGQLERGTGLTEASPEGYLHWQIWIENDEAIRFSTLKNKFPKGHFEVRKGTKQQAYEYVTKSDTAQGVLIYNGAIDMSVSQGSRSDLVRYAEQVLDGVRVHELVKSEPKALRYMKMLEDLQQKEDGHRQKILGWRPVKVTYLSGPTRVGKSRNVVGSYEPGEVYRVTDYKHPFDAYAGEKVLVLDEFRGQIEFSTMLNLLDGHVMELPARYNNRWANYEEVWVVSNHELNKQFAEVRESSAVDWNAFEARFHAVKRMTGTGKIEDISGFYNVSEFKEERLEVDEDVKRNLRK